MGKEIDRVCTVFASLYCLYNHQFILASLFIQSPVFASLYCLRCSSDLDSWRPVTSLGHQEDEEFSKKGQNFLVLNYVQQIFLGGAENIFGGIRPLPPWLRAWIAAWHLWPFFALFFHEG